MAPYRAARATASSCDTPGALNSFCAFAWLWSMTKAHTAIAQTSARIARGRRQVGHASNLARQCEELALDRCTQCRHADQGRQPERRQQAAVVDQPHAVGLLAQHIHPGHLLESPRDRL